MFIIYKKFITLFTLFFISFFISACSEKEKSQYIPLDFNVSSEISFNENNSSSLFFQTNKIDGLTFEISGTDAASFNLDTQAGELSFVETPDYEQKNIYSITLSVSDGTQTISEDIIINIVNLNDNLPIILNTTIDIVENQTTFLLPVSDEDNDTLTFTISGTDASSFTLDSSSGIMTFNETPDFESGKILYQVSLLVSDGLHAISESIDIHISNIIDLEPTLSEAAFSKSEIPDGSVDIGTITIVNQGDTNISSITLSGVGSDQFNIDNNGLVTLKQGSVIDYETQSFYELQAVATNEFGNSQSVDVNISVINYLNPFQIAKIQANNASLNDNFARAVDVSGPYIVVGASKKDTNVSDSGAVYLYKKSQDGSVTQIAKITADNAQAGDEFGHSVSISNDYIVVGSHLDDINSTEVDAGSVYLFKRNSDAQDDVSQIAKFRSNDIEKLDYFGCSVSISGDYIVVGAYNEDTSDFRAGSAYIFKRNSDSLNDVTQVAKIQADDAVDTQEFDNDFFGYSVDIDGDYIIVGANEGDANTSLVDTGSAYLYKRLSDTQVTQLAKLKASDALLNARFGTSVSISGENIVVGAPLDSGSQGSFYLYKKYSDTNVTQVGKIQASDKFNGDEFGYSVSVSGIYIVAGAYKKSSPSNYVSAGSAYLYEIGMDNSVSEIQKIVAADVRADDLFGYSVAIDVNNVIFGASFGDTNEIDSGKAYIMDLEPYNRVYVYNEPTTSFEVNEGTLSEIYSFEAASPQGAISSYNLTSSDSANFSIIDNHLSITTKLDFEVPTDAGNDNNYVLTISVLDEVGNQRDVNLSINVTDKHYVDLASLSAFDAQYGDGFGYSVSSDGDYYLIGSLWDNDTAIDAGSVYMYKKNIDSNITYIAKVQASDANTSDEFGHSVSISGDYFVVGAHLKDYNETLTNSGSAYLYKRYSDTNITELYKIEAADAQAGDEFGSAVAISGDYIVVGASLEDSNATDSGSVYLYKRNSDTNITQLAQIQAPDAQSGAKFGTSVDINGSYFIVGSTYADVFSSDEGSAYLYKINPDDSVSMIQKIVANDAEIGDNFGVSVSISGDYLVVGSNLEDSNGTDSGSAYLYKRYSDANVTQIAKLGAYDAVGDDWFGTSVSIYGDYVAVSAKLDSIDMPSQGSVYIFKLDISNDTIVQVEKKYSSQNVYNPSEFFGNCVSLSSSSLVVGVPNKDSAINVQDNLGGVFIYEKDFNQP